MRVLGVVCAALVACITLALGALSWVHTSGAEPAVAALPLYCEQARAPAACLEVQAAVTASDPRQAVTAVLEGMRKDPSTAENCHGLLHYIGGTFALTLAKDGQLWGEIFPACGYGLLHGVYERLPLPEDIAQVPEFLSGACDLGATDLNGACAHALGHDLVAHWPGQVPNTTQVCEASFYQDPSQARLKATACQIGVLMEEAQNTIRSAPKEGYGQEGTKQWFDNLAVLCSGLPELEKWCPGSFVSAASTLGPTATTNFIAWCAERYPAGSATCSTWAGEHLGMQSELSEAAIEACKGAHETACKAAIFDGARSVRPGNSAASDALVCGILRKLRDASAHLLCKLAAENPASSVSGALERPTVGSG